VSRGAVSETLALAAGRESVVIAGFGVALPRRGKHRLCPFPHHPDRHPSFRWDENKARYFCSCGSGSLIDLVINVGAAHDPLSAAQRIRDILGLEPLGKRAPETPEQRYRRERQTVEALARAEELRQQREAEDAARAKGQWRKSLRMWLRRTTAIGTPVETYLRDVRGITCELPGMLGYLPNPWEFCRSLPVGYPAMIAAFGIPNEPEPGKLLLPPAKLVGVLLTLLQPDGRGKAQIEHPKRTIGIGHNAPIVLAPANDLGGLVIAEGIEEALSWHQETGLGASAAGTANRLPGLAQHVPAHVECVTVIVDRDPAGERYAEELMNALEARGKEVIPCGA
jgi:Toprim domain